MSASIETPMGETGSDGGGQFVTFQIQAELFGVPLEDVREIIRMPDLVQVPLCPPGLEGLANLRGTVLPVTSLRRVFGVETVAHDDATRVMVVSRGGTTTGLVVDRMASVITADRADIESGGSMDTTIRSDLLRGVIKRPDGLVMLLDPSRLTDMDTGGADRATRASPRGRAGGAVDQGPGEAAKAAEIQLVSFEAASREYAFPIQDVQEIVQVPANITQVPQAQPYVAGVMTLRDRLLPLVSLRRMFALPEAPVDEHSRIVVVSLGSGSVGIIMDTVKEVLRVSQTLVDPVPALLSDGGNGGPFEAICRLNGGKRLVTILSAARMFRDSGMRAAIDAAQDTGAVEETALNDENTGSKQSLDADDEEQFVIFRLSGEEYGVPIATVQEIVRVPDDLTKVPKAADFIEGMVNLRGSVLPVVDQRRRFALEEAERNDRQRIMVLTIGGVRTGFIVDQVSEVLKIPRGTIETAPELSAEQARLIGRVANLADRKRMILLLDPANLLETGEIASLRAL